MKKSNPSIVNYFLFSLRSFSLFILLFLLNNCFHLFSCDKSSVKRLFSSYLKVLTKIGMTSHFPSILYHVYFFWFSISSWTHPLLLTCQLKYFRTENLTRVMLTKFSSLKFVCTLSLSKGSRYFVTIYIEFCREVGGHEGEGGQLRAVVVDECAGAGKLPGTVRWLCSSD